MAPSRFGISLLLGLLASTRVTSAEYNPNEHFVLVDCGIGTVAGHPEWSSSWWAMYFTGEVWTDAHEAQLNPSYNGGAVKGDGSYPWRESGVNFKMMNGDEISVTIHPSVNDPAQAGSLTHSFDGHPLTCWAYHRAFGGNCRTAYVCNHKDGPHPAARDQMSIKLSTTKDFAKLKGDIDVADVYGKMSYGDNGECDQSWTDIPGGCTIKFRCHGNKKGTTPAMAKTLKGLATEFPNMVKHEKLNEPKWDPCKSGRDTCVGGWVENWVDYTWVPQTLSIDVSDANDADQGALDYEIDCSHSPQCDVCKGLKFGTGFAAWVAGMFGPELGIPAAAIAQGVSGVCTAEGC
ncbi:hypothetical protein BP5796_12124 [Coleophoma crateriformis]|uniref:Uncharacterized protein n=1 Tax=Coleophoma crateriformis TaxID=565419 RepID=A0A3D8QC28_9HELO|nr:hypothetical protein BP5796_12124 [Coleophoma crateriformis]